MTILELFEFIKRDDQGATLKGNNIEAGGNLYLESLTTLPEGVSLSAGGSLYLESLTTLPEGVSLSAGGNLYLESLTTLPEGVSLSAGGYLDLRSLTTLPEGVSLSAGGYLYLRSLTTLPVYLNGQEVRVVTIDNYTMLIERERHAGDILVRQCRYLRGVSANNPVGTGERVTVVSKSDLHAHGSTIKEALRDLRFKIAQSDFDPEELVEQIKARQTVTFNDYRLLTGACAEGLRQGLMDRGFPADCEEMPLKTALEVVGDAYGSDTFRRLFTEETTQ